MRIYRDLELVELLGSGIPRILRAYGEECFKFTDNFICVTFPINAHDVNNISEHIKALVACIDGEALQSTLEIKHRTNFRNTYLKLSMDEGYIEFTHLIICKENYRNTVL